MIEIIKGNLLNANTQYIAQQCNCITTRGKGLSKSIFDKYPYADIYSNRPEKVDFRNLPENQKAGQIIIKGDGEKERFIINMLAQVYPGPPKFSQSLIDGDRARQRYFAQCLIEIAKIPNLQSISFPYGIGCGLAGGNWNIYFAMLKSFEKELSPCKVYLYQMD